MIYECFDRIKILKSILYYKQTLFGKTILYDLMYYFDFMRTYIYIHENKHHHHYYSSG